MASIKSMFHLTVLFLTSTLILGDEIKCSSCDRPDLQRFIYQVTDHSCPCNEKSAGTLRYHDTRLQFCNGTKFIDVAIPTSASLEPDTHTSKVNSFGTQGNPAKSCREILIKDRNAKSGAYFIKYDSGYMSKTYCHMEEVCGSKGWTMIMKIDGSKTSFKYNSKKWLDNEAYNEQAMSGGLDGQETKLNTYYNFPFNKLCLGMRTNNVLKWLPLEYEARSLYSIIKDGEYKPTNLGRGSWKSWIPGSSLQVNCNREGFNVFQGVSNAKARIGIVSNQENNCDSPDSRIGFGTGGSGCGQDDSNSAGNEARCSADKGDKTIKGFGYIFAQERLENEELGSIENPGTSCRAILRATSIIKSGVYFLKFGGSVVKVYCHMEKICGSQGWTMIMKMDGNKQTFNYDSKYWTNRTPYNTAGLSGGIDDQETKLETYSMFPFSALCLGMSVNGVQRWLKVPQEAPSLYSIVYTNDYKSTDLGRSAWKALIPDSSLQTNCNKEGFNVFRDSKHAKARIGIIGNNEKDCSSPDSRLGFGTGGESCYQYDNNSAGNEAGCSADNGNRHIKGFGYILAQR